MTELVGLPYSPWSEKARWALEVRQVPYKRVTYAPLLGEVGLRRRTGKWSGRVSVPVLFDDDGHAVSDSLAIAQWADAHGTGGETLFPKEQEKELLAYVALSERAMDAGRCLSLYRMLGDDDALREMVPKPLRAMGPAAVAIAAFGIRRTLRKYQAARVDAKTHETNLIAALEELRAGLAKAPTGGTPTTLLGRFSFADIAMTQALGFIEPPSFGIRVGKASRRSFTDVALRDRFADLIAWRDAVYEAHRPRS